MGDTAEEIDHLAAADIEGHHRREVAAKDHPERAAGGDAEGQRHAAGRDLAKKPPAEHGRH